MSFLWRPELAHIQELNGMAKYKEKSKRFAAEKILEKIEPELLKKQICSELLERDYNEIAEKIAAYRALQPVRPVRKRRGRRR